MTGADARRKRREELKARKKELEQITKTSRYVICMKPNYNLVQNRRRVERPAEINFIRGMGYDNLAEAKEAAKRIENTFLNKVHVYDKSTGVFFYVVTNTDVRRERWRRSRRDYLKRLEDSSQKVAWQKEGF